VQQQSPAHQAKQAPQDLCSHEAQGYGKFRGQGKLTKEKIRGWHQCQDPEFRI